MEVKMNFIVGVLEKGEEYNVRHHLTWLKCLNPFHKRIKDAFIYFLHFWVRLLQYFALFFEKLPILKNATGVED